MEQTPSVRGRGMIGRWQPSQEMLALLASLFFSVTANSTFFHVAAATGAFKGAAGIGLAASLFIAITALHASLLLLLFNRWTTKPVLILLLLVTAAAAHFMRAYTIYLDPDMIRNILHTDRKESRELMSLALLPSLFAFGVLPSLLVWRMRIRERTLARATGIRVAWLLASVLVAALAIFASFQATSSLMRNHRELRYLVAPGNYLVSLGRVLTDGGNVPAKAKQPVGLHATIAPRARDSKPRLLVIVVGETVRAQNWGLNGYARQTTPQLAGVADLVNFGDVTACGSSTEVSLPCMFSPYGRHDYDAKRIKGSQSLLNVLDHAGIGVLWRDNQSGCKGVCDGLPFQSFQNTTQAKACSDEGCLDDVMLDGLEAEVAKHAGDQVIVLHQLGNHGPAYFKRYPPSLAKFQPECRSMELRDCSAQQIVNAYDNAILHTDAFLAEAIAMLAKMDDRDTALLYVSDHGESLGEDGLFLHGVPYAIAPKTQLKVPMLMWFSPGMRTDRGIDLACVRQAATRPASHDNLFHSVLGLMQVRTEEYRADLDLLKPCESATAAAYGAAEAH